MGGKLRVKAAVKSLRPKETSWSSTNDKQWLLKQGVCACVRGIKTYAFIANV